MRTVLAGQALTSLVCASAVLLLWRHSGSRYRGLGYWAADYLVQGFGVFLLALRGLIPDLFSLLLANSINAGALIFLYAGTAEFAGRRPFDRLNFIALGAFMAWLAYFAVLEPSLTARVAGFSLILSFFLARCAWALYSAPGSLPRLARPAIWAFSLFVLVNLSRIAVLLSGTAAEDFLRDTSADSVLVLLYAPLLVFLTFTLYSLVNRRLMEDTRADYEGRLAAETALLDALKVARLGTWSWNIKDNSLEWSDQMYRIFGLDREGFSGSLAEVVGSVIHPEDRAAVAESNRKVVEEGKPGGLEYRVLLPGGEVRWVYAEASGLIRDEAGLPVLLKGYAQDITARKNAEKELRETAERLSLALSASGMGAWRWDIKRDHRAFDARVCELLGIDAARFSGQSGEFYSTVHPEDRSYLKEKMLRTLESGEAYSPEYRVMLPGGALRYVAARGRLRRGEKGEPLAVEGLLWDVTERKLAEAELMASEERFQKAFDSAPFLMSLSEVDTGRYIEVNEKFCEVTGYSREELIGRTSTEIGWITPEARARLVRESNGRSLRISEIELRARDGRPVICSYACERLVLSGRNIMLAIAEDLTGRKKAEEALKASEEHFRLVVDSSPDAIFIQTDGKFIYLNSSCCRLFGIPDQKDLIGHGFMDRVAPAYRDLIRERIKFQVDAGKPAPLLELEYLRVDGAPVPVEATAVKVKFMGKDSHLVFVRDISARKRAEAVMQSVQRLESLGTLAGGIAHDFNNLLTGITGNLSLIRATAGAGGEIPELVAEAEAACITAKGLARQLLTFASGGDPVKSVQDIGALVRESVSFSLRGSPISCDIQAEPGVSAAVDKDQVFQVVQNLVINAAQAMPGGGGISVRVSGARIGEGEVIPLSPGLYAVIEVSDTGSGIAPDMLTRLFEPYFSTKGKGRGLGLAVCRSIVAKHGGEITVSSVMGKGSVFRVYLPALESGPRAAAPAEKAAEKPAGAGRVLILEDEEVVSRALTRMLKALGYEAETAVNGELALEAWRSAAAAGKPFSAAIMDLTIAGGMGGAEAVKKLKEFDPSARVIVSSGYAEDAVMSGFREHGFNAALSKPYRIEDLARVLSEISV